MKKLMLIAVAVGVMLGTISFAQDTDKKGDQKTEKKKKNRKKTDPENNFRR